MTVVEVRLERVGALRHPPEVVWEAMVDPDVVAALTPGVDRIRVDGHRWDWRLVEVEALGFSFVPAFEVTVDLDRPRRIAFTPTGRTAEAGVGASGSFRLARREDGTATRLAVLLDLSLDLGIPRMLRRPAQRLMRSELADTADGFLDNLRRHLG